MDRLRAMGIRLPRSLEGIDCKEISILYKDKVTLQAMSPQADNHLEVNYFKHKVHFRCEPYITQSKCKQIRKLLATFRTGSHWLMVCKGRHQRPFLEYSQRCCATCGCIDDEQHAIFDCCKYATARSKFVDLFKHGPNLVAFFTKNPVHRTALFLTACRAIALSQTAAQHDCQVCQTPVHDCDLGLVAELSAVDDYDSCDD